MPESFSRHLSALANYAGQPKPTVTKLAAEPEVSIERHWCCVDCSSIWHGDRACWLCGRLGSLLHSEIPADRLGPRASNTYTPSWETAEGAPL